MLGEVVVHEDTETHGDSIIFDVAWCFFVYFDGLTKNCCLIDLCLYFVCQEMLCLSLFVIYVLVE